jgi:hypothetical protein
MRVYKKGEGFILICAGYRARIWHLAILLVTCAFLPAQQRDSTASQLNEKGTVDIAGHATPYLIRRLPVTSFPDLPAALAEQLTQRGCLIPQTYQAHGPENVVHARLQEPESSDWAVLCSAHGTVSLLVFFAGAPYELVTLAEAPETERLEVHDPTGVLGFAWGIDPASPRYVHEAQAGLKPRPQMIDHDALADTFLEKGTIYHFYSRNAWTVLNMPE